MLPIDTETREWLDARCSWIVDQFGLERIVSTKVIAADAELLDGYRADDQDSVLALFRKICAAMDIEFESIRFDFMRNDKKEGATYAAGLYQSLGNGMHSITIDFDLLESPIDLIATLAHELCHVLLIGHQRITGEEDDHELLTDLLTVFFGFGALSANSVLLESRWQIRRSGYLTMSIYGYALAVFASLRKESSQVWLPRLRLDVRDAFLKSMNHFQSHGLPDMSKVIETDSRPRFHSQYSSAEESTPKLKLRLGFYGDDDEDDEEYEEPVDFEYKDDQEELGDDGESSFSKCVYCGAQARRIHPHPLCADCLVSMEQNELELEEEQSRDVPRIVFWLYVVCGILGVLFFYAALLEGVRDIFYW